ncbi:related to regulatory protein for the arginine catabolic pathway [Phialocephala subalpina]|uniref:Related to regulatory protein for the arginine catabolic pathway n=1 Tax=Phialocephala subalpina TaxID=576137 RepID=A0A1L7XY25_9HELO|nr:related to regulatory protein for the arginine catabolic pathway [Phialocephala subalpina]
MPMEATPARSFGVDERVDEFVNAAASINSPSIPRPRNQGQPMTSPFAGPSYPARAMVDFGMSETSPSLLGLSGFDEYTNDPRFLESHKELRDLLLTSAQSVAPTRVGSPISQEVSSSEHLERIQNSSTIQSILSTGERVIWLMNYLEEVAPWVRDFRHLVAFLTTGKLDMFDQQQNFRTKVPVLAQSSPPLLYALLAISARQMERQKKLKGDQDSLQLYQKSIRNLTPYLLAQDPNIMATCVILCVLEMMSASPWNWRKHLDGCAALLSSHSINGFSGGLLQAVFWCYARMDLCAAIISEGSESVVLSLENWLPPGKSQANAFHLFQSSRVPDMWANYAVYLTARVCHLTWLESSGAREETGEGNNEAFVHAWYKLWSELQDWRKSRPDELLELEFPGEPESTRSSPFPFILYAASCAISSNQLYHTACILLLEVCPSSIDHLQFKQIGSKIWHARRVCGISSTNEHHGCLNNAIQPLWVSGKLLSHPVEHKAVVDLIKHIEEKTGWGGKWRIADLKRVWGYNSDITM